LNSRDIGIEARMEEAIDEDNTDGESPQEIISLQNGTVTDFSERAIDVREESLWLEAEPNTKEWKRILKLHEKSKAMARQREEENELASRYLQMIMEKKFSSQKNNVLVNYDKALTLVTLSLLEEVLEYKVLELSCLLTAAVNTVKFSVQTSVLNGVKSSISYSNRTYRHDHSGHEYLFRGVINDLSTSITSRKDWSTTLLQTTSRSRSKSDTITPVSKPPQKLSIRHLLKRTDNTRSVRHDETSLWQSVEYKDAQHRKIDIPSVFGSLCVLKCFPRRPFLDTFVYAGTSKGRLLLWSVSWLDSVPSSFLAKSDRINKNDIAPVIDIQSSTSTCDFIMSLTKNYHIWVYVRRGVEKSSKWWEWFIPRDKYSTPFSLECIYHLVPSDMNIPVMMPDYLGRFYNGDLSQEVKKAKDFRDNFRLIVKSNREATNPRSEMIPSLCCFHSQLSLHGGNAAILIGCAGGYLIKINLDYAVEELHAPITNIQPFVNVEYVQPANAPENMILATSDRSSHRGKGNRVYRELFHYHKSRVVFMSTLANDPETILSVDENHHVATWKYRESYFKGKCWFEPMRAEELDFNKSSFELIGEEEMIPELPVAANLVKDGASDNIKGELCEPVLSEDGRWVRYSRKKKAIPVPVDSVQVLNDSDTSVDEASKFDYHRQYIKLVTTTPVLVQTLLTQDEELLLFLLVYANAQPTMSTSPAASTSAMTSRVVVVCYNWKLHQIKDDIIDFEVSSAETVKSFTLGPYIEELPTVIIRINDTMRAYSLASGTLISNNALHIPHTGSQFACDLHSLCLSGNVFVHSCPRSSHHFNVVKRISDASTYNEKNMLEEAMPSKPKSIHEEAWEAACSILDSVILRCVDEKIQQIEIQRIRKHRVEEVYGRSVGLGVIWPTQWPPPNEEDIHRVDVIGNHVNPKHEILEAMKLLRLK
jgi:hypothetical protein